MKRAIYISGLWLAILFCLATFSVSAWAWHRSMHCADYLYRVDPADNGSNWHGFGSCRGAFLVGAVHDPSPCDGACYCHDMFPVLHTPDNEALLRTVPTYKIGHLGFGFSRGKLEAALPLAFLVPPRSYRVFYVPYYFLMLLSLCALVLLHRRHRRIRAAADATVSA